MKSDQLQSQQTMSCIKFPLITELVHFANAEKAEVKISMFYLKLIVFANPVLHVNRLEVILYTTYISDLANYLQHFYRQLRWINID